MDTDDDGNDGRVHVVQCLGLHLSQNEEGPPDGGQPCRTNVRQSRPEQVGGGGGGVGGECTASRG